VYFFFKSIEKGVRECDRFGRLDDWRLYISLKGRCIDAARYLIPEVSLIELALLLVPIGTEYTEEAGVEPAKDERY